MFGQALVANPAPNATFFTLDQLNVHNVLEHDASLSRSDAYLGNNHVFNYSVFAESTKYWTGPIMDRDMMANSKIARQLQSKASNPGYRFTNSTENFSIGEILAPFVAFGDRQAVTVENRLVDYFFRASLSMAEMRVDADSIRRERTTPDEAWLEEDQRDCDTAG